MVIRTPISNPSLRSIHISYATLQVEPRRAEASSFKIVRFVEASARSGAKGIYFLARSGPARNCGGLADFCLESFLGTQENQPLLSPPQTESWQSPQAINRRIDPSGN